MTSLTSLWRDRLLPSSIVARMSLVLFVGILIAQILGTYLWTRQFEKVERDRLLEISLNMGARMGQTILFFSRLPNQSRHIVLDQLRDMGGTRFFVSVNPEFIPLETMDDNELSQSIRRKMSSTMAAQLGRDKQAEIVIDFVEFSNLRILSNANLMVELPPRWQRFALLDPGDNSPVVVTQLPVSPTEWLYLATVFPRGNAINQSLVNPERLLSLALVSLTVLILTVLLVGWIVKPLRRLATQADTLGRGQNPEPLPPQGSSEMQTTIQAFNDMSHRIRKFIADRERLFASISHDLKTPLTRARLRAEMLEDESEREPIIKDLENLEALVVATLQMLKEGAIHENTQRVDLRALIIRSLDSAFVAEIPVSCDLPDDFHIEGRPLSLERLFANLIDNAMHYARGVEVIGWVDTEKQRLMVQVCDRGPGLSDDMKARVFEPFFRVQRQPSSVHVGLGMGIVQSIAQLHGASIKLKDRLRGGLNVELSFPL